MQAGDIELKIKKCEAELLALNEKTAKKKKEIAALKKKCRVLEMQERNRRNEKIVSSIEKMIGSEVTEDIVNQIFKFQNTVNSDTHFNNMGGQT